MADGSFQPARAVKFETDPDRRGPRGKDLFLRRNGSIAVSGTFPLYTRPEDVHFIGNAELSCPQGAVVVITAGLGLLPPDQVGQGKPKPAWASRPFHENVAVAVGKNAVVVAGTDRRFQTPESEPEETFGLTALNLADGKPLWREPLPAAPVSWGVAIDRDGRILVTLQDGRVVCFGRRE